MIQEEEGAPSPTTHPLPTILFPPFDKEPCILKVKVWTDLHSKVPLSCKGKRFKIIMNGQPAHATIKIRKEEDKRLSLGLG
jgi:hypothetical protein